MSLLMEALNQAEAKQRNQAEDLRLEPLAERAAPSQNSPASDAARALYAAQAPLTTEKPLWVWLLGGGLVLLGLIGAYVFWQMHLASSATPLTTPGPLLVTPPAAQLPPATPPVADATPAPVQPPPMPAPSEMLGHLLSPRSLLQEKTASSSRPRQEKAVLQPQQPSVRRAETPAQSNSSILQAYEAYQSGNLALARSRYLAVLQQDPLNADALDALGAIAQQQGNPLEAERFFRESLAADPKRENARTQLTLLGLTQQGDENSLRQLVAAQPKSTAARFSLGLFYAQQAQWNLAQQAFFEAHTLDPDHPDVLFNLAVSLDHLGQSAPAKQFYQLALEAAQRRTASFDQTAARTRVTVLGERRQP